MAPAAMVAVHAHRLQQPRPPRSGRPHRDPGHRAALLVVPNEAARLGVRRTGRHRVPALVGERRSVERRSLDGRPHVHSLGSGHLDAQARVLDGLRQVTAQRRPWLVRGPAGLGQQVADQGAVGRLDVRRPLGQYAAGRRTQILDEPLRQVPVAVCLRRDRQPQHRGLVQQPDGDELAAPAPRPDRRGRRPAAFSAASIAATSRLVRSPVGTSRRSAIPSACGGSSTRWSKSATVAVSAGRRWRSPGCSVGPG